MAIFDRRPTYLAALAFTLLLGSCGLKAPESARLARAAVAPTWPDPRPTDPEIQRQAEALAQGFQGAYLIAKGNEVLASGGVGLANRQTGAANDVTTSFRLASVSKPLTAVAVMQLYERGLLELDDVVSRHIPDYGPNGDKVTIRQLLSHSSGIRDYVGSVSDVTSSRHLIDQFRNWALQFTPGSRFSYSNSNFSLLGYLIERITGTPYPDYMREHVFEPAHMLNAGFDFPKQPGDGFAAPSGGNPNGPWESNMKAYAAGALYASVNDMFFFSHALYEGALLSRETVQLMQTRQAGRYGLGVFVDGERIGHDGLIPGFTSRWYSFPAKRGVIMVFSNGSSVAGRLADRLAPLLDR